MRKYFVTKCSKCKDGYYLNKERFCDEINLGKCTLKEIKKSDINLKNLCQTLCEVKKYTLVDNVLNEEIKENKNIYLCLSNINTNTLIKFVHANYNKYK